MLGVPKHKLSVVEALISHMEPDAVLNADGEITKGGILYDDTLEYSLIKNFSINNGDTYFTSEQKGKLAPYFPENGRKILVRPGYGHTDFDIMKEYVRYMKSQFALPAPSSKASRGVK